MHRALCREHSTAPRASGRSAIRRIVDSAVVGWNVTMTAAGHAQRMDDVGRRNAVVARLGWATTLL